MLKKLTLIATTCCVALVLTACGGDDKTPNTNASAKIEAPKATGTPTPATTTNVTLNNAQTAPAASTSTQGQADPFAYCEAKGTIDQPDASYSGEPVPEKLQQAIVKAQLATTDAPLKEAGYVSWRCVDKKVMVCVVGANIPCADKADTAKQANAGMVEFCKTNTNSDLIPAAATGRTTVYMWSCKDGQPQAGEQLVQVDAQGYPADFWAEVKP